MNSTLSQQEMKRAVDGSDATYDGIFFVAVRTTGIVCRPSCPARKPLAKNREYFTTAQGALAAGYRPCKRCRPLETDGRPPAWVAQLLAAVERDPDGGWRDQDLRRQGIEPARARRYFQKHFGMTFQAYCRGKRMGTALQQLKGGARLDDVALGNGYESHSGFRDAFARTFGGPPGQGRATGCAVVTWTESPVGPLLLGATDAGVCMLEFAQDGTLDEQFDTARRRFGAVVPGTNKHVERLQHELSAYFAGQLRRFTVPLVYPGTSFQQKVWEQLLLIPYAETRSYEHIARAAGTPGAQRAVGTANGKNRIAIVIPCHRVVNKSGRLGGYGGGLWRKQFLLDLERGTNND